MLVTCETCGQRFLRASEGEGCPHCAGRSAGDPEPPEGDSDPEPQGPPKRFVDGAPAYEQPGRGFAGRYFGTVVEACFSPAAFFDHLSREGARGITSFAWWSAFIGISAQALVGWLLLPVFRAMALQGPANLKPGELDQARKMAEDDPAMGALVSILDLSEGLAARAAEAEAQLLATAILSPLVALFAVHLIAGLVHVTTRPFAATPAPYVVTHRFVVYAFAPMLFAAIPTVGFFAPLLTLILITAAMTKLHGLSIGGRLLGVVVPVLALNLVWSSVLLPVVAPPVAGLVAPPPAPEPAEDDDPTPPMPPADRPHEVELFDDGDALYSERFFDTAKTRLRIEHRALAHADGRVDVDVRVKNTGEAPWTRVFVEVPVPGRDHVVDDAVTLDGERYELAKDADRPWGFRDALAPGETFHVGFTLREGQPKALLQVGPTVGRIP
jgi:hypothetical protein